MANNRLFVGMVTMNVTGTTAPMNSAATNQRTPPPRSQTVTPLAKLTVASGACIQVARSIASIGSAHCHAAAQRSFPSGSIPPSRIAVDARSEARKPISRFAASSSFDPDTTAAANT